MGWCASDKHPAQQVCHVLKFRDGKVTSFQQFVDTAQLQDVQGAR
jgi:ketosteroid isomerase-like protein